MEVILGTEFTFKLTRLSVTHSIDGVINDFSADRDIFGQCYPVVKCPRCGRDMVEIDRSISHVIRVLWSSGYDIHVCCSGHVKPHKIVPSTRTLWNTGEGLPFHPSPDDLDEVECLYYGPYVELSFDLSDPEAMERFSHVDQFLHEQQDKVFSQIRYTNFERFPNDYNIPKEEASHLMLFVGVVNEKMFDDAFMNMSSAERGSSLILARAQVRVWSNEFSEFLSSNQ